MRELQEEKSCYDCKNLIVGNEIGKWTCTKDCMNFSKYILREDENDVGTAN